MSTSGKFRGRQSRETDGRPRRRSGPRCWRFSAASPPAARRADRQRWTQSLPAAQSWTGGIRSKSCVAESEQGSRPSGLPCEGKQWQLARRRLTKPERLWQSCPTAATGRRAGGTSAPEAVPVSAWPWRSSAQRFPGDLPARRSATRGAAARPVPRPGGAGLALTGAARRRAQPHTRARTREGLSRERLRLRTRPQSLRQPRPEPKDRSVALRHG
jgi:hypothetical protein